MLSHILCRMFVGLALLSVEVLMPRIGWTPLHRSMLVELG